MTENKTTHGGKRAGSGRKPLQKNEKRVKVFISCTRAQADALKAKAQAENKTVSAYLLERI